MNDVPRLPERWVRTERQDYNCKFLNRPKDDNEQIQNEPIYHSNHELRTLWVRYQICLKMLDEIERYRFPFKKWVEKYSDYRFAKNGPLKFVKKIPRWTLRRWYYQTARVPSEMQAIRDQLRQMKRYERHTRFRMPSRLKQRWGKCPFAERIVVEKRKFLSDASLNHGVTWCAQEFNRVLRTPWMWNVAQPYLSQHEQQCWASRGTVLRRCINKMRVSIVIYLIIFYYIKLYTKMYDCFWIYLVVCDYGSDPP